MMNIRFSPLACAAILSAATAVAATDGHADFGDIPDILVLDIHTGSTIEGYLLSILGALRRSDKSGDGLDLEDVLASKAMAKAQARSSAVREVLSYDIDGDREITRAEIAHAARGDEASVARSIDMILDRFDSDGNGAITIAEASENADLRGRDFPDEALLAMDTNGDGKLTVPELQNIAQRTFNRIDSDRNGQISDAEYKLVAPRVRDAQSVRRAHYCDLPSLPTGAAVTAFGSYESDSVSSIAIGSNNNVTNIMDVVIEPGPQPLYVILTSYESMIWRFSGATSRVVHVVASSSQTSRPAQRPKAAGHASARTVVEPVRHNRPSASGVLGIAPGKVTIAPSRCPANFYEMRSSESALLSVRRALRQEPDAVFASYSAQTVSLPSGTIARAETRTIQPPRGFDPEMWSEALRYWPGGLVKVDPRKVVTTARVEPYKVLPAEMGLAQLVGSGAVVRLKPETFRIVKPIAHMPPGMFGAHSAELIVATGVPFPPGHPGHSCVRREGVDEANDSGSQCMPVR
jgi:Ca2+-binding EF-hand superfamily protein